MSAFPVKVQGDKLVVDPKSMVVGTAYRVEYKGLTLLFVKTEKEVVEVYKVSGEGV